jgi:hypothetical protein
VEKIQTYQVPVVPDSGFQALVLCLQLDYLFFLFLHDFLWGLMGLDRVFKVTLRSQVRGIK